MGGFGLAGRDDAEDAARVLLERGVEQCPACRRQAEQRRRAGGGKAGRYLLVFRGVFQERFVHGGPPFSPLSHRCAMPALPWGELLACRSGFCETREGSFIGNGSALLPRTATALQGALSTRHLPPQARPGILRMRRLSAGGTKRPGLPRTPPLRKDFPAGTDVA